MNFIDFNISKQLLNALDDLKISESTTIQEKVFSIVMSGKDVCGIAQTGTGKTYAYLLPILNQFKFSKEKIPQFLILVPTRELVIQVVDAIKQLTTYMNITAIGVYGGANLKPQAAEVAKGADIIVGTPGRLIDLLSAGVINPKHIKKLVIDEFDEMLNLGFRTQLKNIFDKLPKKRQNLLFSATLNEEVEALIEAYFLGIIRVEATPVGTPLENISQSYYPVLNFYTKINFLESLFQQHAEMSKVLVFTSSKHHADLVYEQLAEKFGETINVIHSNKSQNYRFNAVNEFQAGNTRILIATDIIARGLDISEVTHVINLDLPKVPEIYIHRIGRTGRKEQKGIAISLVSDKEKSSLKEIEKLMNTKVSKLKFPKEIEISEKILIEEEPVVKMKLVKVKRREVGPAFHEKSEKNQKVNVRRNHAVEMKLKYGKAYKKQRKE